MGFHRHCRGMWANGVPRGAWSRGRRRRRGSARFIGRGPVFTGREACVMAKRENLPGVPPPGIRRRETKKGTRPERRVPGKSMVGMSGFEPPASASRTQRSSQTEPHPDKRKTAYLHNRNGLGKKFRSGCFSGPSPVQAAGPACGGAARTLLRTRERSPGPAGPFVTMRRFSRRAEAAAGRFSHGPSRQAFFPETTRSDR